MKSLINAEVAERSFNLGLGEEIWYSIDYQDNNGVIRHTVQYGKDLEDACRKINVDWLK